MVINRGNLSEYGAETATTDGQGYELRERYLISLTRSANARPVSKEIFETLRHPLSVHLASPFRRGVRIDTVSRYIDLVDAKRTRGDDNRGQVSTVPSLWTISSVFARVVAGTLDSEGCTRAQPHRVEPRETRILADSDARRSTFEENDSDFSYLSPHFSP